MWSNYQAEIQYKHPITYWKQWSFKSGGPNIKYVAKLIFYVQSLMNNSKPRFAL